MVSGIRGAGLRHVLVACASFLLVGSLEAPTALAQDKPLSLKEILGRAQSEAERRAVEDLIGKLQGRPATAKPQAPQEPQRGEAGQPTLEKSPPVAEAKPDAVPQAVEQPAVAAKGVEQSQPEAPALSSQGQALGEATVSVEKATESEEASRRAAAVAKPAGEIGDAAAKSQPETVTRAEPEQPLQQAAATDRAVSDARRGALPSVDLEVQFAYKSDKLSPEAIATLTTLGQALSDARLAAGTFLIGGHTDAKGGDAYNLELSERRAQAVRQFLIETFSIDGDRLVAKGFGERFLKNPEQPRAAENRRVQIVNMSAQAAR